VGSYVAAAYGEPIGAAFWQYEYTRVMGGSKNQALRGAFSAAIMASTAYFKTGSTVGDFGRQA
jgi:hypothetical protein